MYKRQARPRGARSAEQPRGRADVVVREAGGAAEAVLVSLVISAIVRAAALVAIVPRRRVGKRVAAREEAGRWRRAAGATKAAAVAAGAVEEPPGRGAVYERRPGSERAAAKAAVVAAAARGALRETVQPARTFTMQGTASLGRGASEWVNVCCENIRDLQLLVSDQIPSLQGECATKQRLARAHQHSYNEGI